MKDRIASLVPGHEQGGMWDSFAIDPSSSRLAARHKVRRRPRSLRDEQATDSWDEGWPWTASSAKGGTFVRGEGVISGPGRVTANATTSGAIVIATGTSPSIPPIPGLDPLRYWTNHDAVAVETLPGSVAVLGGGAAGLELGQVFALFGARVVVVEAEHRLLPPEEPEAGRVMAEVFKREGIEVHTAARGGERLP